MIFKSESLDARMERQRCRELASATAAKSFAAMTVRVFAPRAAHWLRRLLAHVTAIADANPTSENAIITYADARAIRFAVIARLTAFERALLWRWCMGVATVWGGLAALLAILLS